MHPCLDDVLTTHELIRTWLGTRLPDAPDKAVLAALLARFSPAYTMVTPGGGTLDHAALRVFFSGAGGSRPGLQMQISDLQLLQDSDHGAVVAYRETQSLPDGSSTVRLSTVVYDKTADGRLLWRHLQETWAAA